MTGTTGGVPGFTTFIFALVGVDKQGMRGVEYWTRDPKEVPNQIDTFIGS